MSADGGEDTRVDPTIARRAAAALRLRELEAACDRFPGEHASLVGLWLDIAAESVEEHGALCARLNASKLRDVRETLRLVVGDEANRLLALIDEALELLRRLAS